MTLKNIIYETIKEALMESDLEKLKSEFILKAQEIYDNWDQNHDGYDDHYGSGGICDDISDMICDIINDKTKYDCFSLYNEYDYHTSSYAYDSENRIIFNIDLPYYIYETGAGYNWKKKPGVKFKEEDIIITQLSYDDFEEEINQM